MTTQYKHTVVEPDQLLYNLRSLTTRQHEHLRRVLEKIGEAYPDDPGTSDLDDSQPAHSVTNLTLGDVRLVWSLLR